MTGLQVAEYDAWLGDVLALYRQAEQARLARSNRQREPGGGRDATLGEGDQMLLTGVWLRQYPGQRCWRRCWGRAVRRCRAMWRRGWNRPVRIRCAGPTRAASSGAAWTPCS